MSVWLETARCAVTGWLPASCSAFLIAAAAVDAQATHAQATPTGLGWVELAPRLEADRVVTVAIGAARDDDGPLAATRLAARRRGKERAIRAISRWADDALARLPASPARAQAVHDAIAARTEVTRVRARADGSALVEVACPAQALRDAFDDPRLPWHRP